MKTRIFLAFAFLLAAALSACSNQPAAVGADQPTTPAAIAAQVCPSVQAVVDVLAVPGAVDPAVAAEVLAAKPIVDAVCSAGAAVQLVDLHSLSANALPTLLKVVPLLPEKDRQAAVLSIAVAQAALAPVIARGSAGSTPAAVAAPQ